MEVEGRLAWEIFMTWIYDLCSQFFFQFVRVYLPSRELINISHLGLRENHRLKSAVLVGHMLLLHFP